MILSIKPAPGEIESFNIYNAITSWKTGLSGGLDGLLWVNLSKELLREVKYKNFKEVKEKLNNLIYDKLENDKERVSKLLERDWKSNKEVIIKEFERQTGIKLDKIACYIIYSTGWGSYSLEKNDIYIHFKMPLLFTLAHELFHLYFYKSAKARYNEIKLWKLSEIVVNLVLFSEKLKGLWPEQREEYYESVTKSDIKIIKELWSNKKDFNSFLKKAMNYVK